MDKETTSSDAITITIKKSYLFVVLALVIGFGGGIGVARAILGSEAPTAAPERTAAAQPPQPSSSGAASAVPQATPAQPTPTAQPTTVDVVVDGRPYRGAGDARVTVVEFTDYQCPFCGRHYRQTMPQLLSEYDGRIKYVVYNYPIAAIHPQAQKASEAAECAYDQGKFWEYHDLLFQNQQALGIDSLKKYASDIELDTEAFATCLDSGAKIEQVLQDVRAGQGYGVTGTPTFFINGKKLLGARPLASFKTLIDAALNGASGDATSPSA